MEKDFFDQTNPVYWAEYKRAWARVGNTVSSTMKKWLLKVITADLDTVSDPRMEELRWEVAAFANHTSTKERLPDFGIQPLYAWCHIAGYGPLSIPSKETVKRLLTEARRHIEELVD